MKNLCSDVPSGPPYVSGDYFKMQFDLSERIIWAASAPWFTSIRHEKRTLLQDTAPLNTAICFNVDNFIVIAVTKTYLYCFITTLRWLLHIDALHQASACGSMTLATTNTIYGKRDPALVDMWGTSYQNMKYQSSLRKRLITGGSENAVRVSRRMGLPNCCD